MALDRMVTITQAQVLGLASTLAKKVDTTDPRLDGGGGTGGAPEPHAPTHAAGGTDPVTLAQSQVTGLTTALTGKVDTTDPRLSDARAPTAHHGTHEPGGSDPLAVNAAAATGSLRTLGTTATAACAGNDARLSDARTPTAHHASHDTGGSDAIAALSAAVLTSGTLPDARLSANVARRDQANTFAADQTVQTALAVGTTPASTGAIRLPNTAAIAWRNAGNTLDYAAVTVDASNLLVLGTNTAGVIAGARVRPVVDATHDLGSGALRWKDVYLSGGVAAAGVVTAGGGLGSTPLNATNLTSGTVPDARLSANVQLKPIAVTDLPAGTVNTSGTPAANQIALFVDADTVTGTPNLLWSGGVSALDLVAGRIHFPGAQNPSSDLSTLDDYREGPWTPFIGGVSGQSGQSYGTAAGTFTKIGRRCTANFWVSLLTKGTITGDLVIGGLTIACGDAAGAVTTALLWNALATPWVSVVGLMQNGNNVIFLRGTSAASTSNNTPLTAADVTNTTLLIGTVTYLAAN